MMWIYEHVVLLKYHFGHFATSRGSAAKLNLTARALSEPAAGEMERAGENDVCYFMFHDSFSANGSLLVWGPGVLDSRDPPMKGVVTDGHPIRIPNHPAPNQQLVIS